MFTTIFFVCSAFAQEGTDTTTNQNKFLLGSSIAFDFAIKNTSKLTWWSDDNPSIKTGFFHFKLFSGYNISPKVALGLKLGLSYYEDTYVVLGYFTPPNWIVDFEYGITDGNSFEIVPFVRIQDNLVGKLKYYFDFGLGTAFSGQMKARWGRNTFSGESHIVYKFNYYYAIADCGLLYLFSQNVGVEIKLVGFEMGKKIEEFGYRIESVNAKFLPHVLQPNIGIVVNL